MSGLLEFVERLRYTYERMTRNDMKSLEKDSHSMHEGLLVEELVKNKPATSAERTSSRSSVRKQRRKKQCVNGSQRKSDPAAKEGGNSGSPLGKIISAYEKYGFFI